MTTESRLAEAWSETALVEIAALTSDGLNAWIVARKDQIAHCALHAPEAITAVRQALKDRSDALQAATIRDGVG